MIKTTVYLPEDLEAGLAAESAATGSSKAELIRTAIRDLLSVSQHKVEPVELPVFSGGGHLSVTEMDEIIGRHASRRAARR